MDRRTVVKASLTPDSKRALDALAKELGMKHQVLFGRLLDWFAAQERHIQLVALGLVTGEDAEDLIDLLYHKRHGLSPPGQAQAPETPPTPTHRSLRAAAKVERAAREKPSARRRRGVP